MNITEEVRMIRNRKMVSAAGSKQGQRPGVEKQGKQRTLNILVGNFF